MRANKPLLHGDITASIIDSFFDVHKELGHGFREYIYSRALERLLIAKGHKVEREVPVMVYFRGEPLAFERMDMLVDETVVIENKAREPLDPDAQGQLFAGLGGDKPRGRPRPLFWEESAVLPRLLRESIQATKPKVPVVAVAAPFSSIRSIAVSEERLSVTAMSLEGSTNNCIPEILKNPPLPGPRRRPRRRTHREPAPSENPQALAIPEERIRVRSPRRF